MADRLKYNTDDLHQAALSVRVISTNLADARDSLKGNLETLRGEWVSDASTKFFSNIDTDWESAVAHYIEMLDELADALDYAVEQYEPLEDAYDKIELGNG